MAAGPGFRTIGSFVGRPAVRGRDPMGFLPARFGYRRRIRAGKCVGSDDKMLVARRVNADSGGIRGLGGIGTLRRVLVSLEVI